MRKRSEISKGDQGEKKYIPNVVTTLCSVCGEAQYDSPDGAGITCPNGHGGADPLAAGAKCEEEMNREREFAQGTSTGTLCPEPGVANGVCGGPQRRVGKVVVCSFGHPQTRASTIVQPNAPKDNGAALKQALKPKDEVELFDHKNKLKTPSLTSDFEFITTSVFQVDALKEYNRLEARLTIGEKRADYGTLLKALDEAETDARKAHQLYVSAKVERDKFELDAEVVQSGMWDAASSSLQAEKDAGNRNKAITDADVKAKAAVMFPDEWRSVQLKRSKVKGMVEHMERFADLWKMRCNSVEKMLSTLRK